MRKRGLVIFVCLLMTGLVFSENVSTKGFVYILEENNSVPFSDGYVSNGSTFTKIEENGYYSIPRSEDGFVFLVIPDGYRCSEWYVKDKEEHNFILEPYEEKGVFVVVSDIHYADDPDDFSDALPDREMIDNPDHYMKKLKEMLTGISPDFIICNGDMIADTANVEDEIAYRWANKVKSYLDISDIPTFYVVGNHEIEKKKDNPIVIYQDVFGPDYYSFNYLGNHFIILNSHNVVNGSLQYEIDSTQLDWLKQDIENISQEVPITFFSHEPIFSLSRSDNSEQLVQILSNTFFNHISGHWHTTRTFFKEPFLELTCGAVCGGWWEGDSAYGDAYGFTLFELHRGKIDYAYIKIDEYPSVWFDLKNTETPLSGMEYLRIVVFPNTSESISVLLNDMSYLCDVFSRQMSYWTEYYIFINFATCTDGINKIGIKLGDQLYSKEVYVKNNPVTMKTIKTNSQAFVGLDVLLSDCINTGQSGKTYIFNDGSDVFMTTLEKCVTLPFEVTKNQKYSIFGIYRDSEVVADPMRIIVSEGLVHEKIE